MQPEIKKAITLMIKEHRGCSIDILPEEVDAILVDLLVEKCVCEGAVDILYGLKSVLCPLEDRNTPHAINAFTRSTYRIGYSETQNKIFLNVTILKQWSFRHHSERTILDLEKLCGVVSDQECEIITSDEQIVVLFWWDEDIPF